VKCTRVQFAGGGHAIVCGSKSLTPKRCSCGKPATKLCDGKLAGSRKTCDQPLCDGCATSPAPGKDYCQRHQPAQQGLAL
jgi:hypothetical protein